MRRFFDTSALIPVFIEDHPHHERSFHAFVDADPKRDGCAAHTLAEFYSTMTRLPGRHGLSGDQVLLFLENIREHLTSIALTPAEYRTTIEQAAAASVVGGTIYDALIARCALKAKAETLYTWNLKHFEQFGSAIVKMLKTP